MITFLIAGHETTSGLLSFAFYYLLRNPEVYQKAQQEVDSVIGKASVTVDHMSKVPYLTAVLRETLRLQPTAPAINMTAKEDTTLGGKYAVKAGQPIICLFPMVRCPHHPTFTKKTRTASDIGFRFIGIQPYMEKTLRNSVQRGCSTTSLSDATRSFPIAGSPLEMACVDVLEELLPGKRLFWSSLSSSRT